MIERRTAEEVKAATLSCVGQLDASVKEALDFAPPEHAAMYRRMAGQVMGHLLTEILIPVYQAYPDLEPEELKKARQNITPIIMPLEIGSKLMRAGSSVALALKTLRDNLAQAPDEGTRQLGCSLEDSLQLILHVQEFLRRVCPGLDETHE